MSVELDRRAQALADRAEVLERQGRADEARQLYRQAAQLEAEVFDGVPLTRPRTRGIVAVDVVSMFWRAGALNEAASHATTYLADPGLPDFARAQLADLLTDCKTEAEGSEDGEPSGSLPSRPPHCSPTAEGQLTG